MSPLEIAFSVISIVVSIVSLFISGKVYYKYQKTSNKSSFKNVKGDIIVNNITYTNMREKAASDNLSKTLEMVNHDTAGLMTQENLAKIGEQWILHFTDYVSRASEEEVRKIWAKILKEELSSKGSVSISLMRTINNLSRDAALSFERIAKYVFSDKHIFYSKNIAVDDILTLQEANLVAPPTMFHVETSINAGVQFKACENKNYMIVAKNMTDNVQKIRIDTLTLTNAGLQLFKILKYDMSDEAIKELTENLKNRYEKSKEFIFSLVNKNK